MKRTEPRTDPESDIGPDGLTIAISDHQTHWSVDRDALRGLARRTLEAEGVAGATISIVLMDDATVHRLNQHYLDHDWPTDVISFRLSEPEEPRLDGELVVSVERAVTEAQQRGAAPWPELALYVVHGLLHLCGYDDQTAEPQAAMRRREAEILAAEGLHPIAPVATSDAEGRERTRCLR